MQKAIELAVERALDGMVQMHRAGYPDTMHSPTPSSIRKMADGLRAKRTLGGRFEGNVFALALITNAYLEIRDLVAFSDLDDLIAENVDLILQARCGRSWKYFSGSDALPHDSDTLSEVVRALQGAGALDERSAIELLDWAISCGWEDGAFNTWLVDNESDCASVNAAFSRGRVGSGRDPEVVANVVRSFEWAVKGDRQLSERLKAARAWLVDVQNPYGFWSPGWYVGACYATFVSIDALRSQPNEGRMGAAIDQAVSWLRESAPTDALNAAWRYRALKLGISAEQPATDDDLHLIVQQQSAGGTWPPYPFIDTHARVWGSTAVTTAVCTTTLASALLR